MTLKELGHYTEAWKYKLYNRDYECLPESMIDNLWDYFDVGGTAKEFNDEYQFGTHGGTQTYVAKLVETEYEKWYEMCKNYH